MNSEAFDEHEKLESEMIFCSSDSDSNLALSTVSFDPLDITAHEGNHRVKVMITERSGDYMVPKTINYETDNDPKTNPTQCDALTVMGNLKIRAAFIHKRTQNETTIYDEEILTKRSKESHGNTDSKFEDRSNIENIESKHKKDFKERCNLWSQCLYCCKNYSRQSTLSVHLKKFHKIDKELTKKASTLSKLYVQDNETVTKYLCNDCDKWFMSLETVQRHYVTVCGQKFDLNDGACDFCNDVFPSNTELQVHKYDYHMVNLEKAAEEIRDLRSEVQKSSNDQIVINQDSKKKRPPKKPCLLRQCPYCHSNYSHPNRLNSHLRQVHKLDENITKKAISLFTLFIIQDNEAATKYSCNDCNKWFGSLETVQRHYETACGQRVDVNVGACEYCNNVFHSNSELQMHHYNYHGIIENTLKPSIKSFTI